MTSTSEPNSPMGEMSLANRSPLELDDVRDRAELRDRYYGLLQELRVLLPGAQVMVAFLFTAPFAPRFSVLDALGRDLYAVALVSGILAVVALMTPIAFHRLGLRTSRAQRLHWAVRTTRLGLILLGVALLSALLVVTRLVFGGTLAVVLTAGVAATVLGAWVALPLTVGSRPRPGGSPAVLGDSSEA